MNRATVFLVFMLLMFPVRAEKTYFDFRYDGRTGEFSVVVPSSNRSYDGYGYNMRTGQMWFNQIHPHGARGVDPYGNTWVFDRRSGAYVNSDGRRCLGFGINRRCNW